MSGGELAALFMLAETLGKTATELMRSGMSSLEFSMWMIYLGLKSEIQQTQASHPGFDVETAIGWVRALEGF